MIACSGGVAYRRGVPGADCLVSGCFGANKIAVATQACLVDPHMISTHQHIDKS
jgi:hypothetical protein